jgi:hypothetical protein
MGTLQFPNMDKYALLGQNSFYKTLAYFLAKFMGCMKQQIRLTLPQTHTCKGVLPFTIHAESPANNLSIDYPMCPHMQPVKNSPHSFEKFSSA